MSFKTNPDLGEKIAIIENSDAHPKPSYLILSEQEEVSNGIRETTNPMEKLEEIGFFKMCREKPKATLEGLRQFCIKKDGYFDPKIEQAYKKAEEAIRKRIGKEFSFPDKGTLKMVPPQNPKQRVIVFYVGSSGYGKTHQACDMLLTYQTYYKKSESNPDGEEKDRTVYIFGRNPNDETVDLFVKKGLNPIYINVEEEVEDSEDEEEEEILKEFDEEEEVDSGEIPTQEKKRKRKGLMDKPSKKKRRMSKLKIVRKPFTAIDFSNSMVLFDDILYIPNEEIRDALKVLMKDILNTGRHENVSCLVTGHKLVDYHNTADILNETDWIMVYPKRGTVRGLEYLFEKYMAVPNPQKLQNRIEKGPTGRWAAIHKKNPQFVLHEFGAFFVEDNS